MSRTLKRKRSEEISEDLYWRDLRGFTDQELLINPFLIDNSYFQDFLFFHYCRGRTNDPNTHLYTIVEINRDWLDATWTEEKRQQAITSKKLDPYFPPVCPKERAGYTFY